MSFTVADLVAHLRLDDSDFRRGTAQAQTSMAGVRSEGSKLGKLASTGFGLGAGFAGFQLLQGGVKAAWNEMKESQVVAAQTAAVIKSTGGVANVTAQEIVALGNKLLRLSGIDDEAIKSGANLLLTFKSIRNEAGKGNDIFNQSVKMALDLSVAWKTDMKSAAIQLGKALEDPISGLTSLRRVGIQFTDAQEAMIRELVEAGQTMDAQKLILKELETQVGGSAAAYGDTMAGKVGVAREQLKNASAEIMEKAVPALAKIAEGVVWVIDAFDRWTAAVNNVTYALNLIPGVNVGYKGVVQAGEALEQRRRDLLPPGWKDAGEADVLGGVLGGFFGGKALKDLLGFAKGGVVPGPIGAAQLAVVHGGERITQNGGDSGPSTIVVNIGTRKIAELMRDYENRNGVGWRTVWTN